VAEVVAHGGAGSRAGAAEAVWGLVEARWTRRRVRELI
jgi:hypothetical protein